MANSENRFSEEQADTSKVNPPTASLEAPTANGWTVCGMYVCAVPVVPQSTAPNKTTMNAMRCDKEIPSSML